MIRVIIADDHALVRRGLREIFEETDNIRVVDEAGDGSALLGTLMAKHCDVVLLDINLPGRNGLDVLMDIRKMRPEQKVLMLSMYPEEEYAVRALKTGAAGYVRKDSSPEEILKAVSVVYAGKKYLNPGLYDALVDELRHPEEGAPHRRLSNRELEIFKRIGRGQSLAEISGDLHLSPKTVSTYRARIIEKTRLKNNAEIVKYVIENGIE